jgi:hypothetical protein
MAGSIAIWAVEGSQLVRLRQHDVNLEIQLETWIESNPSILGKKLLLIGRQVRTAFGKVIDLLALDDEGRCVVIELKRRRTPRDIVAQALDYLSWVAELSDSNVRDRIAATHGNSFDEAYRSCFGSRNPPPVLNLDQSVLIVATAIDEATDRIVNHLSRRYQMDINVVTLSYYISGDQELLARNWIVDPEELEERLGSPGIANSDQIESQSDEGGKARQHPWTNLWHVNLGVGVDGDPNRAWEDERQYGFLSAGQGPQWKAELMKLNINDRVYAYLNGAGYVGGGIVSARAVKAIEFQPHGFDRPLRELPLVTQGWFINSEDPELSEYMVAITWTKTVSASEGVRVSRAIRGTVRKIWSAELAERLKESFNALPS